jgi:hypothetical protein
LALVSRLIGSPALSAERLAGGRNARVFAVRLADGRSVAAKVYCPLPGAVRSRREAEFAALGLCRWAGLRQVPAPLAQDPMAELALYELIEGEPVDLDALTESDADACADFILALARVSQRLAVSFPFPAGEACFSGKELEGNLRGRRDRMDRADPKGPLAGELAAFLAELDTALVVARDRAQDVLAGEGIAWDELLPEARRILSPSDFGFHNALRRPDRSLAFLDFEHFGWDDPVKLLADFLLHPGMGAAAPLRWRFVNRVRAGLEPDDPGLAARLEAYLPLFAAKWCFILLNEFVPCDRERREFAGRGCDPGRLAGQLAKARRMLGRVSGRVTEDVA